MNAPEKPASTASGRRSLARSPGEADVRAAYRLLLGRAPESEAAVQLHLHTPTVRDLIAAFVSSSEFLAANDLPLPADPTDTADRLAPSLSRWRRPRREAPPRTHWVDPLGTLTATSHLPWFEGLGGQTIELPIAAEATEWFALMQALDHAGTTLTVVELGAGWAPWLVRAGVAWRTHRPDQPLTLLGVEGEPHHVLMARSHARDNGLEETLDLRAGAVGTGDGTAHFEVSNLPTEEWGTRVAGSVDIPEGLPRVHNAGEICVPCWSLATLLRDLERVDLLHVDIQGSEAEVLLADPPTLGKVRRLFVGTHARSIEATLLAALPEHGFGLVEEKACRYGITAAGRPYLAEDGSQLWRNLRAEAVAAEV